MGQPQTLRAPLMSDIFPALSMYSSTYMPLALHDSASMYSTMSAALTTTTRFSRSTSVVTPKGSHLQPSQPGAS